MNHEEMNAVSEAPASEAPQVQSELAADSEAAGVTRRGFVSRSGMVAAGIASAPLWMPKAVASAAPATSTHTLVICFLRGGADGLSMVAPWAISGPDTFYEAQRLTPPSGPQLAIPVPSMSNGVIALDDPNGNPIPWMLSEGAAAAHAMYQSGDLAFVHGVGFPVVNNGSHFFSQDYMEDGTQLSTTPSDGNGWGGRTMQQFPVLSPWRGMGYGKILQRTLFGAPKTIAVPDPAAFDLNGEPNSLVLRKLALQFLFNVSDEPLKSTAADSLTTIEQINDPLILAKLSTATYPASPFGAQMRTAQKLIQASADPTLDIALETIMLDYGGWDNHLQMGPTPNPGNEGMHLRMKDFFESLAAFHADLQAHAPLAEYTFVFMTEFGRRITANSGAGVDHGRGSLMGILGSSGVRGGDVYTMLNNGTTAGWVDLQTHSELQGGTTNSYNMRVNIDYRRVLGEILDRRLGFSDSDVHSVFPGYDYAGPGEMPIGVCL